MKKLWYRLRYQTVRYIQQLQFYYKVLRHPILVEFPPLAWTLGQAHQLKCISFTPRGAIFYFSSIKISDVAVESTVMSLAGVSYILDCNPVFMEGGDTYSPRWDIEFTKLDD